MAITPHAHTIFMQIGINGVMEPKWDYLRLPEYDGPITNVNSADLICNGGPNPIKKISPKVANVKAGDTITLQWAHTLDTNTQSGGMVIDAGHKGPVLAYMAKVASATGPAPQQGWFKIYHDGLTSDGKWAVDRLIAKKGRVDVQIPACLQDGDYLLRGELIALHGAGSQNGAQLYMECAQLRVAGGQNIKAPQTYSIPGIYNARDPGILINLYSTPAPKTYTIPGPAVFTC
ncbi:hypothetical protein BJ508DRAFT_413889 [Ascobolus immersus RN42]|uniref:AA9 family lytic polysaccharide monooxygenase n=1 Tax=Ascobolus immersus RN42 TaxID=1160509 RepID=A0A3N4IDD5_ASCIM|nr:hypothetical protein BJ508DRAFT_413889 [Ascobolus immersus RN42]